MRSFTDLPVVTRVSFGLAALLAAIAVANVAMGITGGAIVSSVGVVVATLLGLLSD